ncbi:MAG: hypothetical protein LBH32_07145 [Dysgonamonadaceae bacterium]|nr:hypothetical protein [Dysgonamonadaceae bacterium]
MKKIFNWILDKWLAGFITAGIFFVLKLYIDLPAESKTNFFSFQWFVDLMTTNIPFWIILVIILLTVLKSQSKKSNMYSFLDAPKNHFEKYNPDVFGVHKTQ